MPYIKVEDRAAIQEGRRRPASAGELNFLLTEVARSYWTHSARNYQAINDIIGALEGAKIEFYRRVVADYEDIKMRDNGDVY